MNKILSTVAACFVSLSALAQFNTNSISAYQALFVGTNGALAISTNFFVANSNLLNQAVNIAGGAANNATLLNNITGAAALTVTNNSGLVGSLLFLTNAGGTGWTISNNINTNVATWAAAVNLSNLMAQVQWGSQTLTNVSLYLTVDTSGNIIAHNVTGVTFSGNNSTSTGLSAVPTIVVSNQTSSDNLIQWNPHLIGVQTSGAITANGSIQLPSTGSITNATHGWGIDTNANETVGYVLVTNNPANPTVEFKSSAAGDGQLDFDHGGYMDWAFNVFSNKFLWINVQDGTPDIIVSNNDTVLIQTNLYVGGGLQVTGVAGLQLALVTNLYAQAAQITNASLSGGGATNLLLTNATVVGTIAFSPTNSVLTLVAGNATNTESATGLTNLNGGVQRLTLTSNGTWTLNGTATVQSNLMIGNTVTVSNVSGGSGPLTIASGNSIQLTNASKATGINMDPNGNVWITSYFAGGETYFDQAVTFSNSVSDYGSFYWYQNASNPQKFILQSSPNVNGQETFDIYKSAVVKDTNDCAWFQGNSNLLGITFQCDGSIQAGDGYQRGYTNIYGNYNPTNGDGELHVNASAGSMTVTLPPLGVYANNQHDVWTWTVGSDGSTAGDAAYTRQIYMVRDDTNVLNVVTVTAVGHPTWTNMPSGTTNWQLQCGESGSVTSDGTNLYWSGFHATNAPVAGTFVANDGFGGHSNAAVPTATSSTLGLVRPDNATITISGGVISSTGGGGSFSGNPMQFYNGVYTSIPQYAPLTNIEFYSTNNSGHGTNEAAAVFSVWEDAGYNWVAVGDARQINGSLDANGNLYALGEITSGGGVGNAFVGDGGGITGLNPANLTGTGVVPTAALGTGTANSGAFLQGDQTWQPISGIQFKGTVTTGLTNTSTQGITNAGPLTNAGAIYAKGGIVISGTSTNNGLTTISNGVWGVAGSVLPGFTNTTSRIGLLTVSLVATTSAGAGFGAYCTTTNWDGVIQTNFGWGMGGLTGLSLTESNSWTFGISSNSACAVTVTGGTVVCGSPASIKWQ